jgi:hypothetical protein
MSCHLFGVGDRCQAIAAFQAIELQVGGPNLVTQIQRDDTGTVEQKIDRVPHNHILYVFWDRLKKSAPVRDEQIKLLKKMS